MLPPEELGRRESSIPGPVHLLIAAGILWSVAAVLQSLLHGHIDLSSVFVSNLCLPLSLKKNTYKLDLVLIQRDNSR